MSLIQKIKEHSLIPLFYHNDLTICKKVLEIVVYQFWNSQIAVQKLWAILNN